MTDYLLTFFEGFLAFISPCILSTLPVYFLYLAGNIDENAKKEDKKLFKNSIVFCIGFTLIFVTLGGAAQIIGEALHEIEPILNMLFGLFIIIMGLSYLDIVKINFLHLHSEIKHKVNLYYAFVFGMSFAFLHTACVAPFLATALAQAANSESSGILLLFTFSLGISIPFMLSAILFDRATIVFDFIKKHTKAIRTFSGIFLIIIGLRFFLNLKTV